MPDPLTEDVAAAVADRSIGWDAFRSKTVLVTGATGTIGRGLTQVLSAASAAQGLGVEIVAQGRNPAMRRWMESDLGASFLVGDVRDAAGWMSQLGRLDYVFHCAGVTASAQMIAHPDEVVSTAVDGTRAVLDLALGAGATCVVHVSSMEVYGHGLRGVISERDCGTLDLGDPRSSYPEGKRRAEALAVAYARGHGLETRNARLGLTFGAGVLNDPANTRVPMQFARAALGGVDIELHTAGTGLTNVCYLGDAVRALLLLATRGVAGEAYNIANPQASMSIRDMAEVVAHDVCHGSIEVVIRPPDDIGARGYAPPAEYRLAVDKIVELGWSPSYGMADMYRRMLADWRL